MENRKDLKVVSLFSGCGGMDLGFEGDFAVHEKCVSPTSEFIQKTLDKNLVLLQQTRFKTVFANDIFNDAFVAWINYFKKFGYSSEIYHRDSIVDLVKKHQIGKNIFPSDVDVVTGGFPCQDFSIAGKRKGFKSLKDHNGKAISETTSSEKTRGKLYAWMKEVISITKPKVFIAENVKGLVNLGDAKEIIQKDFSQAADEGYIVLQPQILHAADYGIPQSRERVIFIGIRKNALNKRALKELSKANISPDFNPYPEPTHSFTRQGKSLLPIVTLNDVFTDLMEPSVSDDLSQQHYSKAKYMGSHCQGQTEIDLNGISPTIRSEHHGNIEFRRLSKQNGGKLFSELDNGMIERRLTPRECAIIQTFPLDYEFVIPKAGYSRRYELSASSAYKVIGNAVPPLLAYHLAKRLEQLWNLYFG